MIKGFDHIGLVVKNTEETKRILSALFDYKKVEKQTFPEQGFSSTLISSGKTTIELIEPVGAEGVIQRFVEKNGYGLHHISLSVNDIEDKMKILSERGAKVLGERPQKITETSRIAFLHPETTGGLLIELIERTP